ncbi:MBL fold metallo-hydrolase [Oceanobacillus alkalisoli]|uniref:MBL fold metallo-hydrolase n=1 Tax=Oceanobacillus alkalisoli TaxID=2925113 RepID=UPI001EEFCBC6|nr:MBL fold metallo-hydrolase [Oceanobacillus alkalisoli]MCF3944396.1 MBL fold metallo-hydrolase [Oceanobacillus alkalisoli]MCG5102143.1 MBL fold metallo-hydrolase [Oceanobacillus alkalisoli]
MKRLTFILAFLGLFIFSACEEMPTDTANHANETTVSNQKTVSTAAKQDEAKDTTEEVSPEKNQTEKLEELSVHFIDVGQADATLFRYRSGEEQYTVLFDTGDWRGSEVTNYLTGNDVNFIDLVIVSHPDADHIGQLEQVMQTFDVGEVWMSGNESSSQTFQDAIEAVLASNADYYEPRAGEEFAIGPLQIEILYPDNISGKTNEESISALFTYDNVKFVLTGDAGLREETYMRSNFNVSADVLHLGHHGSKTSNDPAFIDAVSPKIVVYSAGADNSYGHPSPEVVSAIEERNIELYGTAIHGTILLTTNGTDIQIDTNIAAPDSGTTGSEQMSQNKNKETEQVSSSSCVNINEATVEELQQIIHIGPERAVDLIELRPFQTISDLTKIAGIGSARMADIQTEGIACVQ